MRPVSARFLRTLRGSHVMCVRARVCTAYQSGTNPSGYTIPVLQGDVTSDATADVRSTLDLTTAGAGMWPATADSLLAPYGNEVFVERGIELGDGSREYVSLGYYRITTPEQDDAPNGPIRITGQDRMAGLIEARMVSPRFFAQGTSVAAIFSSLVLEVYPDAVVSYDFPAASTTLARPAVVEEDRYGFLKNLAKAHGKVMWFDYRGELRVASPPGSTSPVWTVDAGAGGVLVSLSRRLSREGVYNAVVATGEGTDTRAPVRAVAYDGNRRSPTWWRGRFGKVPRFYASSFITTRTQAQNAATALLRRSLGLPYNLDLSAIPNPALEVFDPIRVVYPATIGGDDLHIIEKLTVPLAPDAPLQASTREQTDVLIEIED